MPKLSVIALSVILILQSACAIDSRGSFCNVYEPVYTAKSDTEGTKRQVDQNNAVYMEMCE